MIGSHFCGVLGDFEGVSMRETREKHVSTDYGWLLRRKQFNRSFGLVYLGIAMGTDRTSRF